MPNVKTYNTLSVVKCCKLCIVTKMFLTHLIASLHSFQFTWGQVNSSWHSHRSIWKVTVIIPAFYVNAIVTYYSNDRHTNSRKMCHVICWRHQYDPPSLCAHFQQQAYNAATIIHHMKKLQLSQSEPSPSPVSMPHIIVHSTSQNDLQTLGPCHDEADTLDPNGNPVHASNHLSCSNPESGRGVCPPLRASHSEPGNALTADETRDVSKFHSEIDAPFRPSKRWELPPCSSCWENGHDRFT